MADELEKIVRNLQQSRFHSSFFGRSIRIAVRCCFGEHTFGVILKSFPAKESIGALSFFARALDKFASWCQRRSG